MMAFGEINFGFYSDEEIDVELPEEIELIKEPEKLKDS